MLTTNKYLEELYKFIEKDYLKTLFPLCSVKLISRYCLSEILESFEKEFFISDSQKSLSFLMQQLVYAAKDSKHVRQTLLLDPFAQIFIYDFVLRNRENFINKINEFRQSFGYTFYEDSDDYNFPSEEFRKFSEKKLEMTRKFQYLGKLDIANCFNNIYHHDIVSFISMIIDPAESEKIGKFLREINGGRSTGCMPQGIFPAKVIGNFFLSFIEGSREIKSDVIIRFMDDIYLFSDDNETIANDFLTIQKLIGEKGLYLNEEKSEIKHVDTGEEVNEIEELKKSLLQKRRIIINAYTGEPEDFEEAEITEDEMNYLKVKLHEKELDDGDLELILAVLSIDLLEFLELFDLVLQKSPHLTKNLYLSIKRNLMYIDEDIIKSIENLINNKFVIQEFQLFWLTKILIDFTEMNEHIVDLLFKIYKHQSATNPVKSLILEIQENNFGLLELKKSVVRGHSHELVISGLIGLISLEKGNRNQIYKYVGKSNPLLRILTLSLKKLNGDEMSTILDTTISKWSYTKTMHPGVKTTDVDDKLPWEMDQEIATALDNNNNSDIKFDDLFGDLSDEDLPF
ncbi:reverse transcriptase domain-containing protein [Fictibacillus enclensis]|uniref:reverse transcriptase domain-containing protein n=1 Tax=Fictibacillus enclensis TaxID=1017270 RepID=UPI0025A21CFE|nr:reverse transcriptase domain-containing protein [Fictibacillus enclensis]MDM5338498.1 reverse transcriptase domain-containing protein [Fictibacillus enclensis]